jgi:hypothetical protein
MPALPGPLKRLQWPWLVWNVFLPTLGPPLFTLVIFLLWMTNNPDAKLNVKSIFADLSPWVLCFFALTLIGASTNELGQPRLSAHRALRWSMFIVGGFALLYAAFIALWRALGREVAHLPVYYVTAILWLAAVSVCHWSYLKRSDPLPPQTAA